MRKRRVHSIRSALVAKAREAALNAIQTFNNPLAEFKSETFIVLMVIAWTYLLHAYYRMNGVDYKYFELKGRRKRYVRIRRGGPIRHWELGHCLEDSSCPLNSPTKVNLRFLIALRNEVEHQMAYGLDVYLGSRFQACCLNFEHWIIELFGSSQSIGSSLSISLQLSATSAEPLPSNVARQISPRLQRFIREFDDSITDDDYNSPGYAYRLLFVRKLTNKKGQADRVIEFIPPNSPLAEMIDKQYWVVKDVEKPKYRAKDIVGIMRAEGHIGFNVSHHTRFWKSMDAKNQSKGYGTDIAGTWYWYDRWVEEVRRFCTLNAPNYYGV